ncbi:MAG: response regulator transcription factor [Fimbriimonadaceae bacterium]|nr:response regulator transcription factor [Fimbriimonadaceae bacterium]
MLRVLVAEDDPIIASRVAAALEDAGYGTKIVYDGEAALLAAQSERFGLIVLDVMMPKVDGVVACQRLRAAKVRSAILMLTARDTVQDRVLGLDAGADDYLIKPFDVRELLARVRALVRRDWVQRTGKIQVADLTIDTQAHTVHRGDDEIRLTKKEYRLLEVLAKNEGRIVPRERLMDALFDTEDRTENTLNFHVASLRKKLEAEDAPKLLHTMHGLGYSLRTPS